MYQENDKLLKKLKKLDGRLLPHLAKSSEDKAAIYKAAELEAMKGITEDMKTTMAQALLTPKAMLSYRSVSMPPMMSIQTSKPRFTSSSRTRITWNNTRIV